MGLSVIETATQREPVSPAGTAAAPLAAAGPSVPETAIEFGRFRLLPRRRQLLVDGIPVELGMRAFDVLMVLIEAGDLLVTKDELLARVWAGVAIEENNLHVQISALRKVLGSDRGFIRTVSGRGYRFTADVRTVATAPKLTGTPESLLLRDRADPAGPIHHPAGTNLVATVSEFVDRDAELAEVLELIAQHRLVTLTGAGGIGKTRLGLEAARRVLPEFRDGVWVAELAALSDSELVPAAVISALGLQPGADRMPPDRLAAALRTKSLLLVLDNCEHVIGAAARSAETLLHSAPGVHLLVTSQEPLGVEGEQIYRLPPLDVPPENVGTAEEAMQHGAIRLLTTRARAADPHFSLNDHNAAAAGAICRRLDGIPLAIELAAVRVATLGVDEVAAHVDDRFRMLTGGLRTALPRHRTLRATLEWSHQLLDEAEQVVLHRLSVFAGGFTLEAACTVVADAALPEATVTDLLSNLVAKSFLTAQLGGAAPRYNFLEPTRAYAREKLAESGELDVARRHAAYYCTLFDNADAIWETTPTAEWGARYAPELENLRVAFQWSFGSAGDPATGIALAGASLRLWLQLSLAREGRALFDRAISHLDAGTVKAVEARLRYAVGRLWAGLPQGRALPAFARAAELYRELGDEVGLGRALGAMGLALARLGRAEEAAAALAEARVRLAASGAQKSLAICLADTALAHALAGRHEKARPLIAEALKLCHTVKLSSAALRAMVYQAEIEFACGAADHAIAHGREIVALCRANRHTGPLGHALCDLAAYLLQRDLVAEAAAALREGLPLAREDEIGDMTVTAGLQSVALIAAREGRVEHAARVNGYVEAFCGAELGGRYRLKRASEARLAAILDKALAPTVRRRLWAEGAAWSAEEAMAAALAGDGVVG
jgi:predicted ATPase/DNA-binding winged helix-turn-helix (wHTH) protein